MVKVLTLMTLLLGYAFSVLADYSIQEPPSCYYFLVMPDEILAVDQQLLKVSLYGKVETLEHVPFFYAHRIYSDAICVGEPAKVFQDRISLVQAALTGSLPILLEVDSRLRVLYMKPFVAQEEFKRYFVTNEYYDTIHALKKLHVNDAQEFVVKLNQIAEEQKAAFLQDKSIMKELHQQEELVHHHRGRIELLSAENRKLRRIVWSIAGVTIFGAMMLIWRFAIRIRRRSVAMIVGAMLAAGCVSAVGGDEPREGGLAARRIGKASENGVRFEVWDEAPVKRWHLREPREFRLRVVNDGKTPIVLPKYAKDRGKLMTLNANVTVHLGEGICMVPGDFPYGLQPHSDFFELRAGAHIDQLEAIVPPAPGVLTLDAAFGNNLEARAEWYSVRTPGTNISEIHRRELPVKNLWTGNIYCNVRMEVTAENSAGVARQEQELREKLKNAGLPSATRRQAFDQFVKADDWVSWRFCCEAIENEKWSVVHDAARARIAGLVNRGFASPEWDAFVKKLRASARWASLRLACADAVGRVAGVNGGDSIPLVYFFQTDDQRHVAEALLKEWAKSGPLELRQKASELLRTVEAETKPPSPGD